MRNKIFFVIVLIALILGTSGVKGQQLNPLVLEKVVNGAIQKAYSASVRIWGYDTVRRAQNSSQFSGVVVSDEGHILSVAHAVQSGKTYMVRFPDGKETIATALGRMSFTDKEIKYDLAMLKINEPGRWLYAEMGWSSALKVNEPCISISYPTLLNQMLPSVRFGKIARLSNREGFVHSTCKMEPGDSGGPLFDYMGRVVALHSNCGRHEDENFEVPVDLYRKYWTALNEPENYKSLPSRTDDVRTDSLSENIYSLSFLEKSDLSLPELPEDLSRACVSVSSMVKGKQTQTLGTLFHIKSKYYVISKNSVVGEDPQIVAAGKTLSANLIQRDTANDLVVMRLDGRIKGGLTLEKQTLESVNLDMYTLGNFIVSPLPSGRKVSIISSNYINLPRRFSIGYFGANALFKEGKIILSSIAPRSPAAEVKLSLGDRITGINGKPISRPEEYGGELRKYDPGDTISIECVRSDSVFSKRVLLTNFPVGSHPAEHFEGGKSVRPDGFKKVFAHDANIRSDECGGPVFDINGKFYGINIARFSRTTTLVIPADVVWAMLSFLY